MDQGKSYLLIYITGSTIKISEVKVGGDQKSYNCKALYKKRSKVAKQHKKGGQSAPRFQRLAQADHKRYVCGILEKVTAIVRKSEFDGVVIAGNGTKKDTLEGLIHENLDIPVLGKLACDGEPEVEECLPFFEERRAFLEEIKPLSEFLRLDENPFVVYGDKEVRNAYGNNALRILIVHNNYIQTNCLKLHKLKADADKRGCEILVIRGAGELQNTFWEGYGGIGGLAWHK